MALAGRGRTEPGRTPTTSVDTDISSMAADSIDDALMSATLPLRTVDDDTDCPEPRRHVRIARMAWGPEPDAVVDACE